MAPDSDLLGRLATILGDVTGASAHTLHPASHPDNTPGWDSVANLGFITAIEEEFQVIIQTSEAMQVRSLGEMARFVARKKAGA